MVGIAALAGGLALLAVRELVLATPAAAHWASAAVEPLRRAGREGYVPTDDERRRLALVVGAAFVVTGVVVLGPGPAPLLAVAGPAGATAAITRRRRRYRARLEASLPAAAEAVADALSAGRSVRTALVAAPQSVDGAAALELGRVAADLDFGAPTGDALAALRRRAGSPRVEAFAAALLSQQLGGGDLAGLLRRFARAARERDRVEADARSATAQARFTGLLVVAMPVGAALFAELTEPGFVAGMLTRAGSALALALATALQAAGFLAIRRLSRIEA